MENRTTMAQPDCPYMLYPLSRQTYWSREWGLAYGPDDLRALLEQYERDGKIGERVLDLGAGDKPVSSTLHTPNEIYLVDIAPEITSLKQDGPPKVIPICQDLESLIQSDPNFFRDLGPIDTMIASSLFNYLNWQRLISVVKEFHNPKGYFFVFNLIGAGTPFLFSKYRPRSHLEVVREFDKQGYEVVEQVGKGNTSIVIAKKK